MHTYRLSARGPADTDLSNVTMYTPEVVLLLLCMMIFCYTSVLLVAHVSGL